MHARDAPLSQCGDRRVADEPQPIAKRSRLLDEVRRCVRYRHYSYRTEQAYVEWTRRFVRFHGLRPPREMGGEEVGAFLDHLANERDVTASTHNQALSALLFLYRDVLGVELPWLGDIGRPRRPRRLPVVLTREEVQRVLATMEGTHALMARLLYGTGMRLMECVRLRVKDLDLARGEIVVRQGKGGKDRVTVLPENLIAPLQQQIAHARVLHATDLAAGRGAVWLPDALSAKYPAAARSWGWQWVFPSASVSVDPRSGAEGRHHLHEQSVQRAVAAAARAAGITKPCTPHVLRHYLPLLTMSCTLPSAA